MNKSNWIRVKNDVNGNGRWVRHFVGLGFPSYDDAIRAAKTIGGRKFHNKQFGGGLAFQAYEGELDWIDTQLTKLSNKLD